MTIASPRAVSLASVSRLRTALLAAASVSLMGTLVPAANAASCATTAAADTCVIALSNGNTTDIHDGQGGSDTVQFGTGLPEDFFYTNANFTTAATAQFLNFEAAVVSSGARVFIDDASNTDVSRQMDWTVNGGGQLLLNNASTATSDANDVIGDNSAVTVNAGGLLVSYENERIGALSGAGDVALLGGTLTVVASNNTFSGFLTGPGNLAVVGTSGNKWSLSGDNDYTGTTTVSSGTLEILNGGAIDQSTGVNISGGELTGKVAYTINSNVTIGSSPAQPQNTSGLPRYPSS